MTDDSKATMQAVIAEKTGQSIEFGYQEMARPVPQAGEILVAVHAAAITKDELDWPEQWPAIPSYEISGVVAELGTDVTGVAVGDEVYALLDFDRDGAAADYAAVPADEVAPKPSGLSHVEAASLPLATLTTWQGLIERAGLVAGQRVLIHGGAGGVGNYAVQLAASQGAEVIATASAKDADYVRGLGAGLVIDYRTDVADQAGKVDVVFDTVGGAVIDQSWQVIRPGGILIAVASSPAEGEAERHGVRADYFVVSPNRAQLTEIARLVDKGAIRPQVGLVLPFTEAAAAFDALANGHVRGKIVLTSDPTVRSASPA